MDRDTTVLVLGDQLNDGITPLLERPPGSARILMVESEQKIASKRWHRQRIHLILSAMRHFAAERRAGGDEVDLRSAKTLGAGIDAHRTETGVEHIVAMAPASWEARRSLEAMGVELVPNNAFLCSETDFAEWADGRSTLRMEAFYRWQRQRLDLLMTADGPEGGRWNYDDENRERPPKDGRSWPTIERFELDEIDEAVIAEHPGSFGSPPEGWWPVTRQQAMHRLDEFVATGLDPFGPHEDAMIATEWKLAHSTLSPALNLGLLHPAEVVEAAIAAYERGEARLNSVEGFVRQIIGWREYVWGLYWQWMPDYRDRNDLGADRPIPPAFLGQPTDMACVANVVAKIDDKGWAHHIERLMVLGNLSLTAGIDPQAVTDWMWAGFVDGAEWVMVPNVVGMALHADGGQMATKPYASGGAYINRMSDHCRGCRFDPRKRTGDDACPFTTLYWDFLARNEDALGANHRMGRPLASMRRLTDLEEVRRRASEVLTALDAGTL